MTRRAPIRLVRLLAVACACLLPAAAANATPPDNDTKTSAVDVPALGWTSLSVSQDIVVQATDWGDATTGPDDADPLPSCTGAVGFRSMWYKLSVSEAAVLRVTVVSTDTSRYQPVVTVLTLGNDEVACGVAALGRPGATANATAYVTPTTDATGKSAPQIYLVRVAQVLNNSPLGGLPMLTVRFAGSRRDTARHRRDAPRVGQCSRGSPPTTTPPTAPTRVEYRYCDCDLAVPRQDQQTRSRGSCADGIRVSYKWHASGARPVVFDVKDRAGNESMYRFTTFVLDTVRPAVSFQLRPPAPGAHRLRVIVKASESVRLQPAGHAGGA